MSISLAMLRSTVRGALGNALNEERGSHHLSSALERWITLEQTHDAAYADPLTRLRTLCPSNSIERSIAV